MRTSTILFELYRSKMFWRGEQPIADTPTLEKGNPFHRLYSPPQHSATGLVADISDAELWSN